jgi:hypothetical protein
METLLFFLLFLQGSNTKATGLPILPIVKEQTRPKNDVWSKQDQKMTCAPVVVDFDSFFNDRRLLLQATGVIRVLG